LSSQKLIEMENLSEAKWVVIFISKKNKDLPGYAETQDLMLEKVKGVPGFVGVQSFMNEWGQGVTLSYWNSRESIKMWGNDSEHKIAKNRGKLEWYSEYQIIITKVDKYLSFNS